MAVIQRTGTMNFFILLFGMFLLIGSQTICPTIYWRDAPEFVDAVFTLGIPHPAGSPTYVLLNHIFSYLPFSNIAWRINFSSTFWFAACCTLLAIILKEVLTKLLHVGGAAGQKTVPFLIALSFALSPAFWMVSSFAEVYTMNAFFVVLLLWFSVRFIHEGDSRYLFAGSFAYGLMAGVHATCVFFLPAVFFLFFSFSPREKYVDNFLLIFFFFLLGFSTYLFLPIRSVANPTFDWGNPETVTQFLNHITDRKTKADHFDFHFTNFVSYFLPKYGGHLVEELGWINIALSIWGQVVVFRKTLRLSAFLNIFVLFHILFFITWKTGDGFIPTNLVWMIFSGVGMAAAFAFLERQANKGNQRLKVRWQKIAALILFMNIVFTSVMGATSQGGGPYYFANKSRFYNAYDTAKSEFQKLPYDAIAIVTLFWFPFRYFQDVEGFRPDVSIVMASDVIGPQFFNPLTQDRLPRVSLPNVDPLLTPWFDYMPQFINLNIGKHRIFYEPHLTLVRPIYKNLRPDQFLFEIVPGESKKGLDSQVLDRYLSGLRTMIGREMQEGAFEYDLNSREYFMTYLLFSSDFLILHGHEEAARTLLKVANELRPNQGTVEFYLAQTDLAMNEEAMGLKQIMRLIQGDLDNGDADLVLGKFLMATGSIDQAEKYLRRAYEKDPQDLKRVFPMVEWFWRNGKIDQSRNILRQAGSLVSSKEEKEEIDLWEHLLKEIDHG